MKVAKSRCSTSFNLDAEHIEFIEQHQAEHPRLESKSAALRDLLRTLMAEKAKEAAR